MNADGAYTSGNTTPASPGTYYWQATFSGDANNQKESTGCADEPVTITKASPTITSNASSGGPVGTQINDVAHLSGLVSPDNTGTVTFKLYDNNSCSGTPVSVTGTTPNTVNADGAYTSGNTTPASPGTYYWQATFSGDANNQKESTGCADEPVTITKATPTLTTNASPGGPVGTSITDKATLAGGSSPTGTITFNLYGPNDPNCTGTPVTTTKTVSNGNGDYTSDPQTPSQAGNYSWTALYNGDGNNNGVSETSCTNANEQVTITKASPTLTTNASPGGPVGTSITDKATLAGGSTPTGTITFNLYGPNDPNCAGTPVSTTKTVNSGNGDYTSNPQTPSQAGNYSWTASYSGDTNNNPVAQTSCTDPDEQVTITKAGKTTPSLTTHASPGGPVGTSITDKATLAGGAAPTGTITFRLYGPNDPTCAGTPVTTTRTVSSGNGHYTSKPQTPPQAGSYSWTASYSGDQNNNAVSETSCTDPNEQVTITSMPLAPTVDQSCQAAAHTSESAKVEGEVNPNGLRTKAHFQYGTTAKYGQTTRTQLLGKGAKDRQVTSTLRHLMPDTTYHCRIVATNAAGTTLGADQTFTTGAGRQTRTSAQAHITHVTARPTNRGCQVEYHGPNSNQTSSSACTTALVTFTGTIDSQANGQQITIVLHTRRSGHRITITGHAQVKHGHFSITVKLPARSGEGDHYTFTITYPGNHHLRPATVTGGFTIEEEAR